MSEVVVSRAELSKVADSSETSRIDGALPVVSCGRSSIFDLFAVVGSDMELVNAPEPTGASDRDGRSITICWGESAAAELSKGIESSAEAEEAEEALGVADSIGTRTGASGIGVSRRPLFEASETSNRFD